MVKSVSIKYVGAGSSVVNLGEHVFVGKSVDSFLDVLAKETMLQLQLAGVRPSDHDFSYLVFEGRIELWNV